MIVGHHRKFNMISISWEQMQERPSRIQSETDETVKAFHKIYEDHLHVCIHSRAEVAKW